MKYHCFLNNSLNLQHNLANKYLKLTFWWMITYWIIDISLGDPTATTYICLDTIRVIWLTISSCSWFFRVECNFPIWILKAIERARGKSFSTKKFYAVKTNFTWCRVWNLSFSPVTFESFNIFPFQCKLPSECRNFNTSLKHLTHFYSIFFLVVCVSSKLNSKWFLDVNWHIHCCEVSSKRNLHIYFRRIKFHGTMSYSDAFKINKQFFLLSNLCCYWFHYHFKMIAHIPFIPFFLSIKRTAINIKRILDKV